MPPLTLVEDSCVILGPGARKKCCTTTRDQFVIHGTMWLVFLNQFFLKHLNPQQVHAIELNRVKR